VGVISINAAGLWSLARRCDEQATAVGRGLEVPTVDGGLPSSSSAVRATHVIIEVAAQQIAARLRSRARLMADATTTLVGTEADNTVALQV